MSFKLPACFSSSILSSYEFVRSTPPSFPILAWSSLVFNETFKLVSKSVYSISQIAVLTPLESVVNKRFFMLERGFNSLIFEKVLKVSL